MKVNSLAAYTPDEIDAALRTVISQGASYADIVNAARTGYGLTEQDVRDAYARINFDPATGLPVAAGAPSAGGISPTMIALIAVAAVAILYFARKR